MSPGQRKGRETILIVDDEFAWMRLFKSILEGANFQTVTAENGQEALQVTKERADIALAIVDYRLSPHLTDDWLTEGTEVCKKLTKRGIPVILASILDDAKAENQAKEAGARATFFKGRDELAVRLISVVWKILDQKTTTKTGS